MKVELCPPRFLNQLYKKQTLLLYLKIGAKNRTKLATNEGLAGIKEETEI